MAARMFDPDNRKRRYFENFGQAAALKKPYTIAQPLDTQLSNICNHKQPKTLHRENPLSQSPGVVSQHLRAASADGVSYHTEPFPDDSPLSTLNVYDNVTESTFQINPQFGRGIDLSDEELSVDDTDVVLRVCFGVLILTVTSAAKRDELDGISPIDLEEFGDMVKITVQRSGKYAGLIRSPVIRELLGDTAIQISATLTEPSPQSFETPKKQTSTSSNNFTARIVISGLQQDGFRVGKLLSGSHLFLQHPYVEECGEMEYCNPHYLMRPGTSMPKLQNAADFGAACTKPLGSLTEINKSRVLQIFDCAGGEGRQESHSLHNISHWVKSDLQKHQVMAVTMMLEREGGGIESSEFPSIWELASAKDPSKRYRNIVTGIYSGSPTPVKGGLLADDMGLGKTLSTLAFICLTLDRDRGNQDASYPTLVVTTKSTLPGWLLQIEKHLHCGRLRTALYHGPHRHAIAVQFHESDVVLTTYETLRSDWDAQGPLYKHQWRRLVLDEAHHIRNRASQIFIAACSVKSYYRWCLTGTPVQNSLDDYSALLSFLCVSGFTEKKMFDFWIARPIQEKKLEGFERLHALVRGTCLRRTKESLGDVLRLPHRQEKVEYVLLHQQDQSLYDFFKVRSAGLASGMRTTNTTVIQTNGAQDESIICFLNFLRLICNHGERLLPDTALRKWNTRDQSMTDSEAVMISDNIGDSPRYSAKVLALLRNLIETLTPIYDSEGNYIPIKSYWTKMLDLIQQALSDYSITNCRIDGSTSLEGRSTALKKFTEDPNCSVMLATIGSAGEGLDLTVANHVHLIEPHWNPMAEAQAVDRVYRIGQQREVFVTRYIVPNSIETYIQWVQQQKLKLVSRFVDTEGITQADIDTERWKQLRENLGCQS